MDLVTPEFSLVIWMTITFGILVFILGKFAWKPILGSLKEREESITSALKSAEEAKIQMAKMQSDNEAMMQEARIERDNLLKEARQIKDQIIAEAKTIASSESAKLLERAQEEISKSKNQAVQELKTYIAGITIELTEKILQKELSKEGEHTRIIEAHLNELENNKSARLN